VVQVGKSKLVTSLPPVLVVFNVGTCKMMLVPALTPVEVVVQVGKRSPAPSPVEVVVQVGKMNCYLRFLLFWVWLMMACQGAISAQLADPLTTNLCTVYENHLNFHNIDILVFLEGVTS
jgi:hypothetical protein